MSPTQEKINLKKTQKVFWDFVGSLRGADAGGLACVGDAYPHVRLHPNSELAALLVWRLLWPREATERPSPAARANATPAPFLSCLQYKPGKQPKL